MGRIAYVGSRTTKERRARGVGLSVWRVDDEQCWTWIQAVDLVNPSYLALASDGRTLFTVHGDQDTVTSLRVLADGTLEPLDTRPTGGRNPVHLSLSCDERTLVVANYATGSVASLPIGAEGSLGEPCDVLAFPGEPGPHRVEQRGSHPHHVPRWPGTDLFVVPDKGLDRVHVVQLAKNGKLSLAGRAVARSASGPRHAAFDAHRNTLWVANELDSTMTQWAFDPATARLTPIRITSVLPDTCTGESRAAGIVATSDGRHVFVSSRGHDSVARTDGTRAIDWTSTEGHTPRFIALSPDERALVAANEGSDTIVRFARADDGRLSDPVVVARTGSPVCVVWGESRAPRLTAP